MVRLTVPSPEEDVVHKVDAWVKDARSKIVYGFQLKTGSRTSVVYGADKEKRFLAQNAAELKQLMNEAMSTDAMFKRFRLISKVEKVQKRSRDWRKLKEVCRSLQIKTKEKVRAVYAVIAIDDTHEAIAKKLSAVFC